MGSPESREENPENREVSVSDIYNRAELILSHSALWGMEDSTSSIDLSSYGEDYNFQATLKKEIDSQNFSLYALNPDLNTPILNVNISQEEISITDLEGNITEIDKQAQNHVRDIVSLIGAELLWEQG